MLIVPLVIIFPTIWGINGIFVAGVASDFIVGFWAILILSGEKKRLERIMTNYI